MLTKGVPVFTFILLGGQLTPLYPINYSTVYEILLIKE